MKIHYIVIYNSNNNNKKIVWNNKRDSTRYTKNGLGGHANVPCIFESRVQWDLWESSFFLPSTLPSGFPDTSYGYSFWYWTNSCSNTHCTSGCTPFDQESSNHITLEFSSIYLLQFYQIELGHVPFTDLISIPGEITLGWLA